MCGGVLSFSFFHSGSFNILMLNRIRAFARTHKHTHPPIHPPSTHTTRCVWVFEYVNTALGNYTLHAPLLMYYYYILFCVWACECVFYIFIICDAATAHVERRTHTPHYSMLFASPPSPPPPPPHPHASPTRTSKKEKEKKERKIFGSLFSPAISFILGSRL